MNFTDILNTRASSIERPKPLPPGTYFGVLEGVPNIREVGKNNTKTASLRFKVLSADDDVDQSQLPDGGCAGKVLFYTMWLEGEDMGRTLWAIKDTLVNQIGVDPSGDKSISQLLNETQGMQVRAYVTLTPTKSDTPELVNNIKSFARA